MRTEEYPEILNNELTTLNDRVKNKWFWEKVDLKVFLAILSLAEPSISQAKVASLLKISPVTMSRLVNSDDIEDRRVRDSWIPILSECLSSVDIEAVRETTEALRNISLQQERERRLLSVQHALEKYFLTINSAYQFDPEHWGRSSDTISFFNETNRWLITLGPTKFRRDRFLQTASYLFSPYTRMRSVQDGDRLSVAFKNPAVFAEAINFLMREDIYDKAIDKKTHYQSLILCDPIKELVLEEFVVFDPKELSNE